MKRWRGLKSLVADAVDHGSRAVERVHMGISRKPFAVLEAIPPISLPAKAVHVIHDAVVATTYVAIRAFNGAVSASLDVAIDVVEARDQRAREASNGAASNGAAPNVEEPPMTGDATDPLRPA